MYHVTLTVNVLDTVCLDMLYNISFFRNYLNLLHLEKPTIGFNGPQEYLKPLRTANARIEFDHIPWR